MALIHSPSIATSSLLLSVDFDNTKNYIGSGSAASSSVTSNAFTLNNAAYYAFSNGTMQFTRTTSPTAKEGGGMIGVVGGSLASATFMYNDHTWEVWFRIDDITPGAYDGTEGYSTLNLYSGYHMGFMYTATTMQYIIWDGITTTRAPLSWTVGTTGAQINQGNWYQIVAVRNGGIFIPYINGVQLGTSTSVSASSTGVLTSNNLCIGKSQNLAAGTGNYLYYANNTISNYKLYNTALTANQIRQNFNALRGRFGI